LPFPKRILKRSHSAVAKNNKKVVSERGSNLHFGVWRARERRLSASLAGFRFSDRGKSL